jgi:hypothetical protein
MFPGGALTGQEVTRPSATDRKRRTVPRGARHPCRDARLLSELRDATTTDWQIYLADDPELG